MAKELPRLPLGFGEGEAPQEEDIYRCIHCGLCLNACPTYVELGLETESPRGRIALMRAVSNQRISITEEVIQHWELCLLCRACEAACPSGVPFGKMMEAARYQVLEQLPSRGSRSSALTRLLLRLTFHQLLPYPWRLRVLARLLLLYQRGGLQWLARKSGLLRLLPAGMKQLEGALPALPAGIYPAPGLRMVRAVGERRARVAFLSGCVMPLILGQTHRSTVQVLARNGCDVVFPKGQVCCGALHLHGGERKMAQKVARNNIDRFLREEVDAIVVNSAGCGAILKEYRELLEDDPAYAERAHRFSSLVKDVNEFLAGLPLKTPHPLAIKVTYQDPCHLAHAQRVKEEPRTLLRSIPGLTLVEMPEADKCCGAAGIYNIVQQELSSQLLDRKVKAIASTDADVIATANPGCMLQLQMGLNRAGIRARVVHVMDLLEQAYSTSSTRSVEPGRN